MNILCLNQDMTLTGKKQKTSPENPDTFRGSSERRLRFPSILIISTERIVTHSTVHGRDSSPHTPMLLAARQPIRKNIYLRAAYITAAKTLHKHFDLKTPAGMQEKLLSLPQPRYGETQKMQPTMERIVESCKEKRLKSRVHWTKKLSKEKSRMH